MDQKNLWQTVLAEIQLNISEANFATWFKNTKIRSRDQEKVFITVPNSFVREWIENKYKRPILKILHNQDSSIKKIDFVVGKLDTKIADISHIPISTNEQLELKILQNNKANLNPKYTFQNFIVGGFNELAHAAACAVADTPGTISYNPLFIYGKVGLGKTHLLQAVGNKVVENFLGKEIKYMPAETLVSGIISSIKNQTIEQFKASHRKIDTLIIDDIQFLAGKEKTQEVFFHIFNTLYQGQKQIILSSDRPPKAIPALTERLRSRFEGGMIADIGHPDLETRIAILRSKAKEKEDLLSEDIYNFLASAIQTNIRELEGALNKIFLVQKTQGKKITLTQVKPLLKEITLAPSKKVTPRKIIQVVAEFYDIKEKEIVSNSRKREIVKPRQIAIYLLRKRLENSYPFIAKKLGNKDHTTAIYSYEKIVKELEKNKDLEKDIELISARLSDE